MKDFLYPSVHIANISIQWAKDCCKFMHGKYSVTVSNFGKNSLLLKALNGLKVTKEALKSSVMLSLSQKNFQDFHRSRSGRFRKLAGRPRNDNNLNHLWWTCQRGWWSISGLERKRRRTNRAQPLSGPLAASSDGRRTEARQRETLTKLWHGSATGL